MSLKRLYTSRSKNVLSRFRGRAFQRRNKKCYHTEVGISLLKKLKDTCESHAESLGSKVLDYGVERVEK